MRRHAQQLIARRHQIGMALPGPRLKVEIKPRHVAQFDHRRRHHREYHRIADLAEGAKGAPGKRLHTLARLSPIFPILELDKGQTHVLPIARKAEPHDAEQGVHDIGFLFEVIILDLLDHLQRPFRARSGGRLDEGK